MCCCPDICWLPRDVLLPRELLLPAIYSVCVLVSCCTAARLHAPVLLAHLLHILLLQQIGDQPTYQKDFTENCLHSNKADIAALQERQPHKNFRVKIRLTVLRLFDFACCSGQAVALGTPCRRAMELENMHGAHIHASLFATLCTQLHCFTGLCVSCKLAGPEKERSLRFSASVLGAF